MSSQLLSSPLVYAKVSTETSNIDRTVVVECPTSRGTAFAVKKNLYMTAKHVVADCDQPQLVSNSGKIAVGRTAFRDSNLDVALIETDSQVSPVVDFHKGEVANGSVEIVGSPIDGLVLSSGTISSVNSNGDLSELHLLIPADHGNSGGPVFLDSFLVGMVYQKNFTSGDVIALGLPTLSTAIDHYQISKLKKKETVSPKVKILGSKLPQRGLLLISILVNVLFVGIAVLVISLNKRKKYIVSRKRITISIPIDESK